MADLSDKIIVYLKSNSVHEVSFMTDVILQDDGEGAYIKEWNLDTPQPTQEQLNALETEADEYSQNVITSKENNKASAKQKLQDLGLTAEEIKETFGL